MKKYIPGLIVTTTIGLLAWSLGNVFPIIGGAVFAIVLGIVISSLIKVPTYLNPGIHYSSKNILKLAIILIGFNLNLFHILEVGSTSILILLTTLLVAFITAYLVGRVLGITRSTTILIGVGTAICGGSAIAATAPIIKANDEEISYSISTIFLFNILAIFIFPTLGRLFGLSDIGFGIWSGTAINDTSSVIAASFSFSETAGNYATIVKLTRTLMIIPITFGLSIITARHASEHTYSLHKLFPFFIVGFLLAAIINTFLLNDHAIADNLASIGKLFIYIAMVGIGFKTNLKQMIHNGYKPILLGLACWVAIATVSLLVQSVLGLL